jgi:hypothetical protein
MWETVKLNPTFDVVLSYACRVPHIERSEMWETVKLNPHV